MIRSSVSRLNMFNAVICSVWESTARNKGSSPKKPAILWASSKHNR